MGMRRSTEESARWLLMSDINIRDVKARIYAVDNLDDLRTWVKVYNQLRDQLSPGRQVVIKTIKKRHEQLMEDE